MWIGGEWCPNDAQSGPFFEVGNRRRDGAFVSSSSGWNEIHEAKVGLTERCFEFLNPGYGFLSVVYGG